MYDIYIFTDFRRCALALIVHFWVKCVRNSGNQPYPTSGLVTGHEYVSTTFVSYLLRALSIRTIGLLFNRL